MQLANNKQTFLGLVRTGLWDIFEKFIVDGLQFTESVDWDKVYQLAEEQSVKGLGLAEIEYANIKLPQELVLQWIGEVQMPEQQNLAMNKFVRDLFERLSDANINAGSLGPYL